MVAGVELLVNVQFDVKLLKWKTQRLTGAKLHFCGHQAHSWKKLCFRIVDQEPDTRPGHPKE